MIASRTPQSGSRERAPANRSFGQSNKQHRVREWKCRQIIKWSELLNASSETVCQIPWKVGRGPSNQRSKGIARSWGTWRYGLSNKDKRSNSSGEEAF